MIGLFLLGACLGGFSASEARADPGASAISLGVKSRVPVLSIDFDELLAPDFALGAGISRTAVPVYLNIYQGDRPNRPLLTVSSALSDLRFLSPRSRSANSSANSSGLSTKVGAGYEYRGRLLCRAALYVLVDHPALEAGINLGYPF